MKNMKLTREQLIELYDCVFSEVHSPGFKEAEMKDLIGDIGYYFIRKPIPGWLDKLKSKLESFDFDLNQIEHLKKWKL